MGRFPCPPFSGKEAVMVTLEEAKSYLRVDSSFEDPLIASLLASSESLCMDVARLSADEWDEIADADPEVKTAHTVQGNILTTGEVIRMKNSLRIAVFFTLGYLYEHREEADHHDLVLTLRNLLFAIREGVV